MSVILKKEDSVDQIREALRQVTQKKNKKTIALDKYFGKVAFDIEGAAYQKNLEMSGNNIIADTSLLLNFFNGLDIARKVMEEQQIWISCITEIELLSYSALNSREERIITLFVEECSLIDLHEDVRRLAIAFRKDKRLNVPDAIIAATSAYLDFPLVTMDGDFKKIKAWKQ